MIDILSMDPTDTADVSYLSDLLATHLNDDDRRRFLHDLDAWNQRIPPDALMTIRAYHRAQQRGAFVPMIIRNYLATVTALAVTPEWQAVMSWQERILQLEPTNVRKAA